MKYQCSVIIPGVNAFFERESKNFWFKDNGVWLSLSKTDMLDYIKESGYSNRPDGAKDMSSPATRKLMEIRHKGVIDMVLPLAGWNEGVHEWSGKKILVTSSPKIVQPKEGDWELLRKCQESLLGHYPMQIVHERANDMLYLKSLLEQRPRQRTATCYVGEADCGKTFNQERRSERFGGRVANPWNHINGQTGFNSEMFVAEHLMISDPTIYSQEGRADMTNMLKNLLFNEYQCCHKKFGEPISVPPNWFLDISCNNEPHNLAVRSIDKSFIGKVNLYHCQSKAIPPEGYKDMLPEVFLAKVRECYAAYHWHLLNEFKIPAEIQDRRTGVKAYHNPEILSLIQETLPELRFLELLDELNFTGNHPWTGSFMQLIEELADESHPLAKDLIRKQGAVKVWLAKLKTEFPDRVVQKARTKTKRGEWVIFPPTPVEKN